jgi:DNA repair protein RadD
MSELWPHQQRGLIAIRASIAKGNKWIVAVGPCGMGKTRLATFIANSHVAKGGRVLWLTHRNELVEQAADELTAANLSVGCIQASGTRAGNPYRPVQVASIQTLVARQAFPECSLVIYDECHHSMSDTWVKIVQHYKAAGTLGIGLTATPCRADGRGLGDVYDDLVEVANVSELIDAGFLVPLEIIRPPQMLESAQIAQDPLKVYLDHGVGRQTLVFAANLKAAHDYLDSFTLAGIRVGMVTGEASAMNERRRVIDAFKLGKLDVVINVAVLTEGYDHRPASFCILARSCGSNSLFRQIVGRVMRASPETGKTGALLADLHGATHVFGLPTDPVEYSLDGEGIRTALEKPKERFCAICKVLLTSDMPVCPDCGFKHPELLAPEVMNVALVKYAAKRREGTDKRAFTLAKWMMDAREAGHKPARASYKYKAVYGDWADAEVRGNALTIFQTMLDKKKQYLDE